MATGEVRVKISDAKMFRLFMWRLKELQGEMRVSADPFAEDLGSIIDQFTRPQRKVTNEEDEPEEE